MDMSAHDRIRDGDQSLSPSTPPFLREIIVRTALADSDEDETRFERRREEPGFDVPQDSSSEVTGAHNYNYQSGNEVGSLVQDDSMQFQGQQQHGIPETYFDVSQVPHKTEGTGSYNHQPGNQVGSSIPDAPAKAQGQGTSDAPLDVSQILTKKLTNVFKFPPPRAYVETVTPGPELYNYHYNFPASDLPTPGPDPGMMSPRSCMNYGIQPGEYDEFYLGTGNSSHYVAYMRMENLRPWNPEIPPPVGRRMIFAQPPFGEHPGVFGQHPDSFGQDAGVTDQHHGADGPSYGFGPHYPIPEADGISPPFAQSPQVGTESPIQMAQVPILAAVPLTPPTPPTPPFGPEFVINYGFEIPLPSSVQWPNFSRDSPAPRPLYCPFCANIRRPNINYTNHRLRHPITGILECPELRNHICETCGATGDFAHTRSYCPHNRVSTQSGQKRSST